MKVQGLKCMNPCCMGILTSLFLLSLALAEEPSSPAAKMISLEVDKAPFTTVLNDFSRESSWTLAAFVPQPEPLIRLQATNQKAQNVLEQIANQAGAQVISIWSGRATALPPAKANPALPWIRQARAEILSQVVYDFALSLSQEQREQLLGGGQIPLATLTAEQAAKATVTWQEDEDFLAVWGQGREKGYVTLQYRPRILFLDKDAFLLFGDIDVCEVNRRLNLEAGPAEVKTQGPFGTSGFVVAPQEADSGAPRRGNEAEVTTEITLEHGLARPLKEWIELLKQHSGWELYVDQRAKEVQVFISAGRYSPRQLSQLLAEATGMEVRSVGPVKMFARRSKRTFGTKALERLRQELVALLPPQRSDVREADLFPWDSDWFLSGTRVAVGELTEEQQTWLAKAWEQVPHLPSPGQIAQLQFVPSFVVTVDTQVRLPITVIKEGEQSIIFKGSGANRFQTWSW